MMPPDLKTVETHFQFGENWQSFLKTVTPEAIAEAERGLKKLFPNGEVRGSVFVDVGCGSGLSMLAALRLGAKEVRGSDIDPRSVAAATHLLQEHMAGKAWTVELRSVFDLDPATYGSADIVHSWGVIHHTGSLWEAFDTLLTLVAEGGHCAVALYRRTPLCGFWQAEKKLYARSGRPLRSAVRALYKSSYWAGLLATRRNPLAYVRNYTSARGMDWHHDVHDWLGGYPYESVEPREVQAFVQARGFDVVREFERPVAARGLFGSHCDEFVVRRAG